MVAKKEKRYIVTLHKVIYARNDNEAKFKAAKMANELDANTEKVTEKPFASLSERVVSEGELKIFENKIIEI